MIKTRNRLFLIILLQVLLIVGIATSSYAIDWMGKEIRLKTAPIDPRDLFYGDYVTLNYEISQIPYALWHGTEQPEHRDTVYVVLAPKEKYYEVVAAYPSKPQLREEQVLLKGKVLWSWRGNEFRVDYGMDRYYVPEGTGLEIERNRENYDVLVKIAPWGQGKIVDLVENK